MTIFIAPQKDDFMEPNENIFKTMVEAIDELKKKGYIEDLNLKENYLLVKDNIKLNPEDFTVDCFYRFEENTDPAEQAILYAISAPKFNLKGLLVNSYGIYSDPITDSMTKKLQVH